MNNITYCACAVNNTLQSSDYTARSWLKRHATPAPTCRWRLGPRSPPWTGPARWQSPPSPIIKFEWRLLWNEFRHNVLARIYSLFFLLGLLFSQEGFSFVSDILHGVLTLKRVGGHIVPPLARLRYSWQKLLLERTQIVIVNSSISIAVVLRPFWVSSNIRLNFGGLGSNRTPKFNISENQI